MNKQAVCRRYLLGVSISAVAKIAKTRHCIAIFAITQKPSILTNWNTSLNIKQSFKGTFSEVTRCFIFEFTDVHWRSGGKKKQNSILVRFLALIWIYRDNDKSRELSR